MLQTPLTHEQESQCESKRDRMEAADSYKRPVSSVHIEGAASPSPANPRMEPVLHINEVRSVKRHESCSWQLYKLTLHHFN